MRSTAIITAIAAAALVAPAAAKNIDLVTLPDRDTVQLTIYNSEDITLVKETRHVTLKKGANKLQFSWANTLIDPTSVELRPLEHAGDIEIADTVFPGQKPQHLYWNIESAFEGQVRVEVSYFTSGLTWRMDYVAVADPQETELQFRGYVRVYNNSGEDYQDAEIRLIVGQINLVEKIADLARRYGIAAPKPGTAPYKQMQQDALRESFAKAAGARGQPPSAPKQIVKEGLSEYFMFTVYGTETVLNGWSKRMRAIKADHVAFDIVYRMREHQYGPRPVRFFIWRNDHAHHLGDCPLPDGLVRVFRENGKDALSYLGQQLIRYVPIKAPIEVNLGPDDLVVYERMKMDTRRFNFHFRDNRVCGWDERQSWIDTIRNHRRKPIVLELRRVWGGDVEYAAEHETTLFDYHTVEATFRLAARTRFEYRCAALIHHGTNAKQNRVTLREEI